MYRNIIRSISILLALLLLGGCAAPKPAPVEDPTLPTLQPEGTEEAVSTESWAPVETEQTPTEPPTDETTEAPSTEPAPTEPTPTEAPKTEEEQLWEEIAAMTLEEKVAQMIICTPEALTGITGTATMAGEKTKAAFDALPVGGILYMGGNLQSPEQVKNLCWNMQQISLRRTDLPVFLCVDEEGGTVARISGTGRFDVPAIANMSEIGAAGDPAQARAIGEQIGTYLSDLGFNVDFAPDADVLTNEANTVVRYRSFGTDGALVSEMACALAEGLQSKGVLATFKHFPGHGGTAEDSHEGFAVSYRTLDELRQAELIPFRDAAINKIPFVMAGHITLPNVTDDGLPASLSHELLTEILRGELGFEGIIVTDALSMGAIAQNYTPAQAAVLAVQAGNDMLLISDNLQAYVDAIVEAVRSGEIPEQRIDESVYRIVKTKLAMQ